MGLLASMFTSPFVRAAATIAISIPLVAISQRE